MKLLLATMLVLAMAIVPSVVGAQDTKGSNPSPSTSPSSGGATGKDSRTSAPSMPGGSGSAPSASPSTAGAPASTADCMNGGWAKFTDQKFKDQADCVSWAEKQGKGK